MTDKELQQLLRTKLQDYEVPLPANDWDALQARRNGRRNHRPIGWWVAAACFVGIIGISAVFFGIRSNMTPSTAPNTAETTIPHTIAPTQTPNTALNSMTQPTVQKAVVAEKELLLTQNSNLPINTQTTQSSTRHHHQVITTQTIATKIVPPYHTSAVADSALNDIIESLLPNTAIAEDTAKQPTIGTPDNTEQQTLQQEQRANEQFETLKHIRRTTRNHPHMTLLAGLIATGNKLMSLPYGNPAFVAPLSHNMNYCRSMSKQTAHYDFPFTVGFTAGIPIMKRLDVLTGLNYTLLHTSYTTVVNGEETTSRESYMHYIGIPLKLSYRIIDHRIFNFYVAAGGAIDKGLVNTNKKRLFNDNAQWTGETQKQRYSIQGVQWSVTANLGLGIKLFKGLSFVVEPGFTWYAPNRNHPQPPSNRTEHPYNFCLGAGLRFDFQ